MDFFKEQPDFTGEKTHLEILMKAIEKKNIAIWNTWRRDNKKIIPNLQRVYLNGECFDSKCLKGADFSGSFLKEAIFHGTNLEKVNFTRADLSFSDLSNTVMRMTDCREAIISNTNFIDAKLFKTDLRNTDLFHSIIMVASFSEVNLTGAGVYKTQIINSIVEKVKCRYVYIDLKRKKRFPLCRDFRKHEFEEIAARHKVITGRIKI